MPSPTTFAPSSGAEHRTIGRRSNAYRPHLDGLRAVAVYLVVAFHAGVGRLAGGFIGVDVFFVLSGYLVTQLLLRDLDQRGTIALGAFYARRARRLLPADRAVASPTGQQRVTAGGDLDWKAARDDVAEPPDCNGNDPTSCVVVEGSGPTILLLGDSHAQMLIPTLAAAARSLDLRFAAATRPQCAWFLDLASAIAGAPCDDAKDDWYGPILDELDPDIVVLSHSLLDDARAPNVLASSSGLVQYGAPGYDDAIANHTDQSIAALRRDGRSIVIVEPIPQPVPTENPLSCLADTGDLAACRFVSPSGPGPEERYDRSLDKAHDDIFSLDLDRLVCPYLPICDPVVDGQIVMRDQTHLTASFTASLGGAFADYLLAAGVATKS